MKRISKSTTIKELAAIISSALTEYGIEAVLVGGAAVSIYTDNQDLTYDLDFVSPHRIELIAEALQPLSFARQDAGRHFTSPHTDFLIEFPARSLNFGETSAPFNSAELLETSHGVLKVITPTQSIMDRLGAYFYWGDRSSLDQANSIAGSNLIDWDELFDWVENEGQDPAIVDVLKEHAQKPSAD